MQMRSVQSTRDTLVKVESSNIQIALPDNKTEHIPGYLPLVSGMPLLLQETIPCELHLFNGTPDIFPS
ncbi:unnamed protein product [Rotaria sp. Silwood2]|nr:unnamed protein product [Rotaria sp. Silwood2]CAF4784694.1 unnamed protein product [Rotaria sp. Silwood2]